MTNKRCKTCVYRTMISGNLCACEYILHELKRRPCPSGAECTVYKRGTPLGARKQIQFSERKLKKCKMCGKEMLMSPKQKYCNDCNAERDRKRCLEYYAARYEARRDKMLKTPRQCRYCGKTYFHPLATKIACPECDKLSEGKKRTIRKHQKKAVSL